MSHHLFRVARLAATDTKGTRYRVIVELADGGEHRQTVPHEYLLTPERNVSNAAAVVARGLGINPDGLLYARQDGHQTLFESFDH